MDELVIDLDDGAGRDSASGPTAGSSSPRHRRLRGHRAVRRWAPARLLRGALVLSAVLAGLLLAGQVIAPDPAPATPALAGSGSDQDDPAGPDGLAGPDGGPGAPGDPAGEDGDPGGGSGGSLTGPDGRARVGPLQFYRDLAGRPALASDVGRPGQAQTALRFVPGAVAPVLTAFCRTPSSVAGAGDLDVLITLNRMPVMTIRCGPRERVRDSMYSPDRQGSSGNGDATVFVLRPGEESVLRAELRRPGAAPAAAASVRLGLAVYEPVTRPARED